METIFRTIRSKHFYMILMCMIFQVFSAEGSAAVHKIPSCIIRLPDNENAIVVEKSTQTLYLYGSENNVPVLRFSFPCSTGEVNGTKQKAGDRKTPEGIYFLKDRYDDKYLSPVYGKKAFPTDYPNFIDQRAGRDGSAIWLHGTNKKLKPMDSNGCIAMENASIVKLSKFITLDSTAVIIADKISMEDSGVVCAVQKPVAEMINRWVDAFETETYHEYLGFYSSSYLPDMSWWEQWVKIRKKLIESGSKIHVKTSRMGIYRHGNILVALFDYGFVSENRAISVGKRKLFLKIRNGSCEIIGDVFQKVSKRFSGGENPLTAAAGLLVRPVFSKDAVLAVLHQWMSAWSAKDMKKYASFYADDFVSDGMNKSLWVKRKARLAARYRFIRVSGRDFKIVPARSGNTCEVSFFQTYKSSGLTTSGIKKIKLVNKGGSWKIYRESWKGR